MLDPFPRGPARRRARSHPVSRALHLGQQTRGSVLYAPLMSERAPGLSSESDHLDATRAYYDEFAARYEAKRGGRDPSGYHDLVDDLEVAFVERFGRGRDVLEVGCGTGLLLERFQAFAR